MRHPSPQPTAPLPPELAFVVQLQGPGHQPPEGLVGRAEHIASGQTTRFTTLAELYAFMGQSAHASNTATHRNHK